MEKYESIEEIKGFIKDISLMTLKKPFEYDPKMLSDVTQRKKLKKKLRKMGLGHLHILKHLSNLQSDELLKRSLLNQQNCIVRIYMVNAFALVQRDNGSNSDPYVSLKLNGQVQQDRDSYQLDNPNPEFN